MRLFSRRLPIAEPALPVLQTERLVLRCFDMNDAVDVFNAAKNEESALAGGWTPHRTIEDSRAWISQTLTDGHAWAVVEKKTGRVIGTVSLFEDRLRRVDKAMGFDFMLSEGNWYKGFATETCREVMRYAFSELECVILSYAHLPQNANGKRIIKKLNFVCEGVLRCARSLPDGTVCDLALYSLTEAEYRAQNLKNERRD